MLDDSLADVQQFTRPCWCLETYGADIRPICSPVCDCHPAAVASPSLVPFAPTDEQLRFLKIHASSSPPHMWRWHFQGEQLRACSEAGCCTISKAALGELYDAGLMKTGYGHQVQLTSKGRALCF